jgi:hypothetical protein
MTEPADDLAKTRFFTLQLARLSGFICAAVGIWLWRAATQDGGSTTTGKLLFALGLFSALVVPAILARSWRSKS